MNHGIATAKKDIRLNLTTEPYIKEGDSGVITAFLPYDERFAVDFGNGKWITFQWKKEQFLEEFEVILNNPMEDYE